MPLPVLFRVSALSLVVIALASCQPGAPSVSSRAEFKKNYFVARSALEGGQYAKAARQYADMLGTAGPLAPRIRLEYAHALLRDGKYEKAAAEARIVAGQLRGSGRSAALAVQGTADHERARENVARGRSGATEINLFKSAALALDEMLKADPKMDPLGAMATRRRSIDLELLSIQ
jgi:hypothetical protein